VTTHTPVTASSHTAPLARSQLCHCLARSLSALSLPRSLPLSSVAHLCCRRVPCALPVLVTVSFGHDAPSPPPLSEPRFFAPPAASLVSVLQSSSALSSSLCSSFSSLHSFLPFLPASVCPSVCLSSIHSFASSASRHTLHHTLPPPFRLPLAVSPRASDTSLVSAASGDDLTLVDRSLLHRHRPFAQ
jgi:hypothetical protein